MENPMGIAKRFERISFDNNGFIDFDFFRNQFSGSNDFSCRMRLIFHPVGKFTRSSWTLAVLAGQVAEISKSRICLSGSSPLLDF